jgi:phosphoribosyl-dephospho-CoA transferase
LTARPKGSIITLTTTNGTAMKTNKELNQAHDAKQAERVRPAAKEYEWEALDQVIRQWITKNEQA